MASPRRGLPLTLVAALGLAGALLRMNAAPPVVAAFDRFHRGGPKPGDELEAGLLLLNELNCVACHEVPNTWRGRLRGRERIGLADVGQWLEPVVLQAFIADPPRFKPGTTMPKVVLAAGEDEAIAAYLASLRTGPASTGPEGDADRGRRLHETIGCVACHSPDPAVTTPGSVPLALAGQHPPRELAAFLREPLRSRPAGRMPAFELSEREAADLAAFLHSRLATRASPPEVGAMPHTPASLAGKGRAAFATRGCAACHDDGAGAKAIEAISFARAAVERGCLAEQPSPGAADYHLDEPQRRALSVVLTAMRAGPPPSQTPEQQVAATFAQLNCYACHEWRGRGGVEASRATYFVATEGATESLGELARLPPKLDQAGRKLTSAWLAKLLWGNGGGVRPYMSARMPRFGEGNAGGLVSALEAACRPERPLEIDTSGAKGHQRFATGLALIGTGEGGMSCVACHGLKDREPPGIRAVNLTHSVERLRPEYFKALLLDPQGVQPGTIMPPLFSGRKNADREIESIWTYLKELDQSPRLPEGLRASDSFELKPEAEGRPIVFRTFLEGAGVHAVAVGFPAGVHAAFDALEVRWALAWGGRFLDAMANWEERTMPPVKPLGERVTRLPEHVAVARLPDGAPWPANGLVAAGLVFKGYRLQADGTPVFRYRTENVEVEDSIQAEPGGTTLRRRIELRGSGDGWFFRGIAPGAQPRRVEWRDGAAVFEERLALEGNR